MASYSSSSLLKLLVPIQGKLLLIVLLLSSSYNCYSQAEQSSSSSLEEEAAATSVLLDLKKSLTQDDPSNNIILSSWTLETSSSLCTTWFGIECDHHPVVSNTTVSNVVTALRIPPYSGLVGRLSPSLSKLTHLRTLSLPNNRLYGPIPPQLSLLPSLQTLDLHGNNLSGSLPHSFIGGFPSLSTLDLSNNHLSGTILIGSPSSSSCVSLVRLKLSTNYFTGTIPSDIGICVNLRTVLIDGNFFGGPIPHQLGLLTGLTVLDVSRNSLVGPIPKQLGHCKKLSVLVLTNLTTTMSSSSSSSPDDDHETREGAGKEFNAFEGGIPYEVLSLPSLQVVWAPRANLGGRLGARWSVSCSLRVVNLGQNYLEGVLPESFSMCKNITFLDLSSNNLKGHLPSRLQVPCMSYFNISRNLFSGTLPEFLNSSICDTSMINSYGKDRGFLNDEDVGIAYSDILPFWATQDTTTVGSNFDDEDLRSVVHDFSRNWFFGPLPIFSFVNIGVNTSYTLLLNINKFNGSFPEVIFADCDKLGRFSVNLSSNKITGELNPKLFLNCWQLTNFEAAQNRISGPIPPEIGRTKKLQLIDLSNNLLFGTLPDELGNLKHLKRIFLRANNFTGHFTSRLGDLTSLKVLDLSHNALTGQIPRTLANATSLQTLLLNHNNLSGEIPAAFSTLPNLVTLNLSYNNLSGHIPYLQRTNNCDNFIGNRYLNPCPDRYSPPPAELPVPLPVKQGHGRNKFKSFMIAMATTASIVFFALLTIVLVLLLGKRRNSRVTSLRKKVMVTFADAPTELSYDDVVEATGNFSISNLIGTGGFGSTYKAELVPGFFVAVKRLSIGKLFQGIAQFDAEIRTLGTIRHRNLVTLVGYYMGEAEMFLIYNYLSGGNLETFIHEKSGKNMEWKVVHKIAYDIAKALSFLHYSCVPRIVHRDIKPSNILLDEDLNAYLSDFGLARLLEVSQTHATTDVAGTFGYVAPEYATTCRVSDKADVYSFGVVLLELMSGKRSLDPSFCEYGNGFNIVTWARLLIREGRFSEIFCPELWESGPRDGIMGMLRIASTCTVESMSFRPTMKQVIEKLKLIKP